jgi:small subunit ribosomal protein S19e
MTDAKEVPAPLLVRRLAEELKKIEAIRPPPWARFVRTGAHTERAPLQPDWWYVRSASVLRKVYIRGPVGISRLAQEYGGRRDRGSAPYHAVSGSRSVAQEIVHQLERSGLLVPVKQRGRRLSPAGQSLLHKASREILSQLAQGNPALRKYL